MGTFISMEGGLGFKNDAPEKTIKKILAETIASCTYDPEEKDVKKMSIKDILASQFDTTQDSGEYLIEFHDECSYAFADSIEDMFRQLAPYLEDESHVSIEYEDDDYQSLTIRNGTIVKGERHDFYTDDGDIPSDDELADAIIRAADILKKDPSKRIGLFQKMQNIDSLEALIDVLQN